MSTYHYEYYCPECGKVLNESSSQNFISQQTERMLCPNCNREVEAKIKMTVEGPEPKYSKKNPYTGK